MADLHSKRVKKHRQSEATNAGLGEEAATRNAHHSTLIGRLKSIFSHHKPPVANLDFGDDEEKARPVAGPKNSTVETLAIPHEVPQKRTKPIYLKPKDVSTPEGWHYSTRRGCFVCDSTDEIMSVESRRAEMTFEKSNLIEAIIDGRYYPITTSDDIFIEGFNSLLDKVLQHPDGKEFLQEFKYVNSQHQSLNLADLAIYKNFDRAQQDVYDDDTYSPFNELHRILVAIRDKLQLSAQNAVFKEQEKIINEELNAYRTDLRLLSKAIEKGRLEATTTESGQPLQGVKELLPKILGHRGSTESLRDLFFRTCSNEHLNLADLAAYAEWKALRSTSTEDPQQCLQVFQKYQVIRTDIRNAGIHPSRSGEFFHTEIIRKKVQLSNQGLADAPEATLKAGTTEPTAKVDIALAASPSEHPRHINFNTQKYVKEFDSAYPPSEDPSPTLTSSGRTSLRGILKHTSKNACNVETSI